MEANYIPESWATFRVAYAMGNSAEKATALESAVNGLVLTDPAKASVAAMSAKMKRYFDGQNNSAVRALTLHMDEANNVIRIQVFDPTLDLVSSIPGTGMKTAFTEEPINFVTAQNGTAVSIYNGKGQRDILSAALAIANAMEQKFGIDAMSATLGDILLLDKDVRTMKFMFGCSDAIPSRERNYNATYTLKFEQAPITFAAASRAQVIPVGTEVTLVPTTTLTSLIWSSSNTAVATVDQSGKVTGIGDGIATISATADGVLMPAQAKITVLGANSAFTYGYSESDLKIPSGLTKAPGSEIYKGTIDLPAEGEDSALFIKMPNVDGLMSLTLINSMGTFEFAEEVTLKNGVLKIPSKIVRDSYSEERYALNIHIGEAMYAIRFNNAEGTVPSVDIPVVDPNTLLGTYECSGKRLYVAVVDNTVKAYLPGDTGWSDIGVSDGIRILNADGTLKSSSVKMGYSENVQVICGNANNPKTLTIANTKGTIGILKDEVYTYAGPATVGGPCTCGYWFNKNNYNDKYSEYEQCTCPTVNGVCPHEVPHFTVCTDPNCTDITHIIVCGHNSTEYSWQADPIIPCPAYHLHADKDKPCRNVGCHKP